VLKVCRPGFGSLAESGQSTLKVGIHSVGIGRGSWKGPWPPWIFVDATDKVEGSLIV